MNPPRCPEVKFLSIRNLLEDFDSCNAEAIVEIVLKVLEGSDMDVSELSGFKPWMVHVSCQVRTMV